MIGQSRRVVKTKIKRLLWVINTATTSLTTKSLSFSWPSFSICQWFGEYNTRAYRRSVGEWSLAELSTVVCKYSRLANEMHFFATVYNMRWTVWHPVNASNNVFCCRQTWLSGELFFARCFHISVNLSASLSVASVPTARILCLTAM